MGLVARAVASPSSSVRWAWAHAFGMGEFFLRCARSPVHQRTLTYPLALQLDDADSRTAYEGRR